MFSKADYVNKSCMKVPPGWPTGLDGWKVLETALQTCPQSRVIIITAHGKGGTREMAKDKGAWAYVEKPYVLDKIKKLLK